MTSVALHEIVFDHDIYPRATWSQTTVDRYADAMLAGEMFPPIILESGTNRLLDGMHRTEAFRAVGKDLVPVDYREIPDGVPAKLFAASLSARNGDRITVEDMRRTAREVIQTNPNYSLVFVASYLGVSRNTVSKYVSDLVERRESVRACRVALLSRAGMKQQEIADHLSLSQPTVSRIQNVQAGNVNMPEDVLREAAADLPVDDAEELVAAILAERSAPRPERSPFPGPSDAAIEPPVDPGATPPAAPVPPDPQEPDLTADVVRVLAGAGELGMTVPEIWCRTPGGTASVAVKAAVDALCEAGRVLVASTSKHGTRWMLTPEPGAAAAPSGSGPAEVASAREGGAASAPEPKPAGQQAVTYAARQSAGRIVAAVRDEVAIIIAAVDLGEDLITAEMVAGLQAAVDLLASRLEANA